MQPLFSQAFAKMRVVSILCALIVIGANAAEYFPSGSNNESLQEGSEYANVFLVSENAPIKTRVGQPLMCREAVVDWTILDADVPFSINTEGQIRVDGPLDYEVRSRFTFDVAAVLRDGTRKKFSTMVRINNVPEVPSVQVSRTSGLVTSEQAGIDGFEVMLSGDRAPVAPVHISLLSSDPGEGVLDAAELVFTAANWNIPQVVTITGVNDDLTDSNVNYMISLGSTRSVDPAYNELDVEDVYVTNLDNDKIRVTPIQGLATSENGDQTTFTVQLGSPPWDAVTLPLSVSNPNEGQVYPRTLTFTRDNWNKPQTVIVTGVDDKEKDGLATYRVITGMAQSLDSTYAGLDPDDVMVLNLDNESAPYSVIGFQSAYYTASEGGNPSQVHLVISRTGNISTSVVAGIRQLEGVGSAEMGTDFTLSKPLGPLVFDSNISYQTLTLDVVDDDLREGVESVHFEIYNPVGSDRMVLGISTAALTILDDESSAPDSLQRHIELKSNKRATVAISFTEHRDNLLEAGLVSDLEPITVKAVGLPDGARFSFDPKSGRDILSWTPTQDQVGEHTFKLRAIYLNDEVEVIDVRLLVKDSRIRSSSSNR